MFFWVCELCLSIKGKHNLSKELHQGSHVFEKLFSISSFTVIRNLVLFEPLSPITTAVWVLPEFEDVSRYEIKSFTRSRDFFNDSFHIGYSVSKVNCHFLQHIFCSSIATECVVNCDLTVWEIQPLKEIEIIHAHE